MQETTYLGGKLTTLSNIAEEYRVFEKIPDAKVELDGLRDLKQYLTEHITSWNGQKVLGFLTFGSMIYVRTKEGDGFHKRFYGYVDDVAHNVQKGFYEEGQ